MNYRSFDGPLAADEDSAAKSRSHKRIQGTSVTEQTAIEEQPARAAGGKLSPADRLILLVVTLAVLLPGIHVSLFDRDEGWYAQVTREMVASGDYLVPTYLGEPWLGKPPLLYWLAAPIFSVAGRSEWALRLVPVMSMVVAVQLLATLAARLFHRGIGMTAALVFMTAALPAVVGRLFITDGLLLMFVMGAVLALERLSRGGKLHVGFVLGICVGLGILTKGPPILLYIAGFGGALLIARSQRRWALGPPVWLAAIVTMIVVLPWYLAVAARAAETLWSQLFVYEFLARFTAPAHGHVGPPGYYAVVSLAGWLPWTPLIPGALFAAWQQRKQDRNLALCFWWFALPWIVFELVPGKLPHYVLPCFVPIAICFARFWEVFVQSDQSIHERRALRAWFVLPILGGIGVLAVLTLPRIAKYTPGYLPISGGVILIVVLISGGAAGLRFVIKRKFHLALQVCVLLAIATFVAFGAAILPAFEKNRLSRTIAETVNEQNEIELAVVACGYDEPTMFFYLDAPAIAVTPAALDERLANDLPAHTVLILAEPVFKDRADQFEPLETLHGLNYVRGRQMSVVIAGHRAVD